MKYLVSVFVLSFLLAMSPARGHGTLSSESQFELDQDLANTIYQESVEKERVSSGRVSSGLRVEASFGLLNAERLVLTNQYFDTQYTNAFSAIPSFRFSVSHGIAASRVFDVMVLGAVGFGRKESLTTVKSKLGGTFRDTIQLNWLPLSAGIRTEISPTENSFVRPYLEAGVGINWLYQSGKLDRALEQGFWIPFYKGALGAVLFGNSRRSGEWFGGITAGASFLRSFATSQVADAWSLDVGASMHL